MPNHFRHIRRFKIATKPMMTTISSPLVLTNLLLRRASRYPGRAAPPVAGGARMGEALFKTPNAANQNSADKAKAASVRSLIEGARNLVELAQASTSTLASIVGNERDLTAVAKLGIASGKIITVSDGDKTAVYSHAAANGIEDFVDAVNSAPGLNVKASLTSDGRLRLDATSINSIVIGGTATAAELSSIGLSAMTLVGRLNPRRFALAKEYDSTRERIDAVALKTEVSPANAIDAKLAANGAPVTAASLGMARVSYISDGNFQSNAAIEAARADLAAAADKLAALTAPGDEAHTAHAGALARSVLDYFAEASSDPAVGSAEAALQLARDLGVNFATTPFAIINTARTPTLLTV